MWFYIYAILLFFLPLSSHAQSIAHQNWQTATISSDTLSVSCAELIVPFEKGALLDEPAPTTQRGEMDSSLRSSHPVRVKINPESGTSDIITSITGTIFDGCMLQLVVNDPGDSITIVDDDSAIELSGDVNVVLEDINTVFNLVRKSGVWVPASGFGGTGGGGGSGTITSILGCTGASCNLIEVPDGAYLLDFSGMVIDSAVKGLILPQSAATCGNSTGTGQACFHSGTGVLSIGGGEGTYDFTPGADLLSIFSCTTGACAGVLTLSDGDGLDLRATNPDETLEGLRLPMTADCDNADSEASLSYDSTSNEVCIGHGGSVTRFSAGGSGDITSVMGCTTGACPLIEMNDGHLLYGGSMEIDEIDEGIILPGHPSNCAGSGGTSEGQVCWQRNNDTLWIGTGSALVQIGGAGSGGASTLDEAFDNGGVIDGAVSREVPLFIGNGDLDGFLFYVGVTGPTMECVLDWGGGGEDSCDLVINAAAGDSILMQQDGATFIAVSNAGVALTLPSGDVFSVTINSESVISATNTTVTVPVDLAVSGDLTGKIHHTTNTAGGPIVLAGKDCAGGLHENSDADAVTFTLCDGQAAGGQLACFIDRAGGAITVDVFDGAEVIKLSDGTALAGGEAIILEAGIGNALCIKSDNATSWYVLPGSVGTITEQNP